jgi:hypothetical protein
LVAAAGFANNVSMHPWHFQTEGHFEVHCQCIERGRKHMERGEWTAAVAEINLALEAGESPNAHWNRALMLLALGRYGEACDGTEVVLCWSVGVQMVPVV